MHRKLTTILTALAVAAVPVAAQASAPSGAGEGKGRTDRPAATERPAGKKPKKNPRVAYRAKGVVKAVDVAANTITITVGDKPGSTNRAARAWRGTDVTFDVSAAKLTVKDVNGDGSKDLADVAVGDLAKVMAKLPKRLGEGDVQPFKAKKVNVKHPEPAPSTPPAS